METARYNQLSCFRVDKWRYFFHCSLVRFNWLVLLRLLFDDDCVTRQLQEWTGPTSFGPEVENRMSWSDAVGWLDMTGRNKWKEVHSNFILFYLIVPVRNPLHIFSRITKIGAGAMSHRPPSCALVLDFTTRRKDSPSLF